MAYATIPVAALVLCDNDRVFGHMVCCSVTQVFMQSNEHEHVGIYLRLADEWLEKIKDWEYVQICVFLSNRVCSAREAICGPLSSHLFEYRLRFSKHDNYAYLTFCFWFGETSCSWRKMWYFDGEPLEKIEDWECVKLRLPSVLYGQDPPLLNAGGGGGTVVPLQRLVSMSYEGAW